MKKVHLVEPDPKENQTDVSVNQYLREPEEEPTGRRVVFNKSGPFSNEMIQMRVESGSLIRKSEL